MAGDTTTSYWDTKGLALLWMSFFAGPIAWTLNQGIGYAVMKPVCRSADVSVLWLIGAFTFVLACLGAWTAARCLLALGEGATDAGGSVIDRSFFVAIVAIGMDSLIALLIVTSIIPQLLLSPCE
jgi:hypothetical protein